MTTSRKARAGVLCLLALSSAVPDEAQAFLLYTPGVLGEGTPVALNEPGQVVGRSHDAEGDLAATLWEPGNEGPAYLLPGERSEAYDINDGGAILAGILGHKYVLLTDHGTTDLPPMSARALNSLTQVVGYGIWEAGAIRSIDGVHGMDINDRGQVTGHVPGGPAVVWDEGTIVPVEPAGVAGGWGVGINGKGEAVGGGTTPQRRAGAFYWDGVASVVLATLAGEDTGVHAINDLSQIVGWSDAATGERHACLWEEGAIADLNDLLTEAFPYTLVDAVDINNRGQIACLAVDASGGNWAVLLNPIPEPGTLLLPALGGAAAALRRRRRR